MPGLKVDDTLNLEEQFEYKSNDLSELYQILSSLSCN